MTVLSEEKKSAFQADLSLLLASYGMPHGYVVCMSNDGYALVLEGLTITEQMRALASGTHCAIVAIGVSKAPIIHEN